MRDLTKERRPDDGTRRALRHWLSNKKLGHATLARQIITLEKSQATGRSSARTTELAAKLPAVERQRDKLAAKPEDQAAPLR